MVKRIILSGECQSAAQVARQAPNLGLPAVSANTIRRALRRQGLVAKVKPPKRFLTKSHMCRRLEWCNVTGARVTGAVSRSRTKQSC